jgi:hypothetical protein
LLPVVQFADAPGAPGATPWADAAVGIINVSVAASGVIQVFRRLICFSLRRDAIPWRNLPREIPIYAQR